MTRSPDSARDIPVHRSSKTAIQLSLIAAAGLVLFLFESFIPRPLPWLKPGLANIATLFALYSFGVRAALIVTLLRIVLGSLILGSLFNPAFILSLGGGIAAVTAMAAASRLGERAFSVLGVSAIGAFCHNLAQISLAYFFIIQHSELFLLLPVVLLSSLFTGFAVGLISHFLLEKRKFILV